MQIIFYHIQEVDQLLFRMEGLYVLTVIYQEEIEKLVNNQI